MNCDYGFPPMSPAMLDAFLNTRVCRLFARLPVLIHSSPAGDFCFFGRRRLSDILPASFCSCRSFFVYDLSMMDGPPVSLPLLSCLIVVLPSPSPSGLVFARPWAFFSAFQASRGRFFRKGERATIPKSTSLPSHQRKKSRSQAFPYEPEGDLFDPTAVSLSEQKLLSRP